MYKVLIVDDEVDMRYFLRDLFEDMQFEVCEAANGAEALVRAFDSQPELIILDIEMPVMDGWEALKWLRASEEQRSVPVIIVSGSRNAKERHNADRPENCVFLSKPFEICALEKTIQIMLPRRNMKSGGCALENAM